MQIFFNFFRFCFNRLKHSWCFNDHRCFMSMFFAVHNIIANTNVTSTLLTYYIFLFHRKEEKTFCTLESPASLQCC